MPPDVVAFVCDPMENPVQKKEHLQALRVGGEMIVGHEIQGKECGEFITSIIGKQDGFGDRHGFEMRFNCSTPQIFSNDFDIKNPNSF